MEYPALFQRSKLKAEVTVKLSSSVKIMETEPSKHPSQRLRLKEGSIEAKNRMKNSQTFIFCLNNSIT